MWDSSALLALLDGADRDHGRAAAIARQCAAERRPPVITNYIEAECHALLLRELGRQVALNWLLHGSMEMLRATPAEETSARYLLSSHRDKDWSLCDAVAFSVAASRGIGLAFSFDHHFRQFGRWRVLGLD